MTKNILIHNDNSFLIDDIFEDNIKFEPRFSDIDICIQEDIVLKLINKNCDVIFIKDNLSQNYLELLGLRVAYHIRLSGNLKNKRYLPIVILSDLDGYLLAKLQPMAKILFTKNIFIIPNTKEAIENISKKEFNLLSNIEYKNDFLDKIEVEQSKDTSGSHDIANKWSIYKWAEFLEIKSEAIDKNKNEIEHELYFKYLVALSPSIETYISDHEIVKTIVSPQTKIGTIKLVKKVEKKLQKVLYIDDEFYKGWEDIFKAFFAKKHKHEFQFTTIKEMNKDTTYDELENWMIEYIKKDTPDLIILDMRLTKEDHAEQNEKNLSGIKLLKYIKEEINPGIQVILLTASGKSKILNEANQYDILGYIKKEHPQDIATNIKKTFDTIKELLDEGLEKQYLKEIWNIQQEILKLDIFKTDNYYEIKLEVESVFEVLNSQMENRFIYSMFAIFKILESLVKFYIEEKKENGKRYAYWINTNNKIPYVNENNFLVETKVDDLNDRTENKIRVLLHEKVNIKDKIIHDSINNLVQIRNSTIHPKNNKNSKNISKDDIVEWFKVVYKILAKI